jgi:hypothetical protein
MYPARRRSIDLAVAGAGTACTSKSVHAVQPTHSGSWLRAVPAGCLLVQISEIPDCPSWDGGSIPAPATDTDGGLGVESCLTVHVVGS